jgi:alpha,alpha-trehalase
LLAILCAVIAPDFAWAQTPLCATAVPPSEQLGDLFELVQLSEIFPDGKTFTDLVPDEEPAKIVADYQATRDEPGFNLGAFVHQHFSPPGEGPAVHPAAPDERLVSYIARLWEVLKHSSGERPGRSSLLSLPYPYVVPGGRFRELYYWDFYFIMLGLEADGRHQLALDMVKDFAFEPDCYGHIPNGNRTYYLSRSQPPFFSLMMDLIAAREGEKSYLVYLPELESEYYYWMDGAAFLRDGQAYRRVVRLADGTVLNRYWDDRSAPRDESYREDVITALGSRRDPGELYRDIRAAAESGWDFSSRWLADGHHLNTIRTVSLLPVDLNSLMFHLEQTLAKAYRLKGDVGRSARLEKLAAQRQAAIRRLMWKESSGMFTDYVWQGKQPAPVTAAGLYPLFFHIATAGQAEVVARSLRSELLMPGGLATTLVSSGQQWDQPNGWAPLQWIGVVGLRDYHMSQLAETIARRWTCENIDGYQRSGTLVEKYNLIQGGGGVGENMPCRSGSAGLTVYCVLLHRYIRACPAST